MRNLDDHGPLFSDVWGAVALGTPADNGALAWRYGHAVVRCPAHGRAGCVLQKHQTFGAVHGVAICWVVGTV